MAAKIQTAGLFASCGHEDDAEDAVGFAAAGKGRLRMANASRMRNSATEPRKNGSNLWAAVHATMSEHSTAPTPQKKFSRLTAPARALGPEAEPDPISAIRRLSVGMISPSPSP